MCFFVLSTRMGGIGVSTAVGTIVVVGGVVGGGGGGGGVEMGLFVNGDRAYMFKQMVYSR